MKVLTFSGQSPAEALKKVKAKLGDDVMIIETKQVRKKTINQAPLYEILVGVQEHQETHDAPKHNELSKKKILERSEDVILNISKAAKQFSEIQSIAESSQPPQASLDEHLPDINRPASKAALPEEFKAVKKQIDQLVDKVSLIQNMFWEEKNPSEAGFPIPPEFAEIYKLSKESGMLESHLEHIMRLTLEHMPMNMRNNSTTVKRYFQVLLRKMIPVRLEMPLKNSAKKLIMLVGPTGVGKTTTVAKLAARYSYLLEKKYKVGLIVLDTYRIGAVEQLMQYARMMKLGIETVLDPPEFTQAINALSYCDYILIDTMGSSPYDQEKISKLQQFLEANHSDYEVETTLVMPSHFKYEDMHATFEQFSPLNIDTLIFTKLDETKGFGTIFSLIMEIEKPVSYFSIGQEVPEDLVAANSDYLVDCLLHGFKKDHHE